jgi:putative copper resistance protein D
VYVLGLSALYFTPAFGWLTGSDIGHVIMQVHFIVTGYLFAWILDRDRSPATTAALLEPADPAAAGPVGARFLRRWR